MLLRGLSLVRSGRAVNSIHRWNKDSCNPIVSPISAFYYYSRQFSTDDPQQFAPGMESDNVKSAREILPVTFADISRANVAIRSGIKRTTCEKSYFLSELLGANIFLKTEFRQFTGSFKERGARNACLYHLSEREMTFNKMELLQQVLEIMLLLWRIMERN